MKGFPVSGTNEKFLTYYENECAAKSLLKSDYLKKIENEYQIIRFLSLF